MKMMEKERKEKNKRKELGRNISVIVERKIRTQSCSKEALLICVNSAISIQEISC